ncbi:MAG: cytochrome c biogenesis protein ResB [Dehalococcoidia bacterium]
MAGNAASEGRTAPRSWSRSFGLINPLRAVWWLFTNVRFAIVLLLTLVVVSLVGVLVPQMPANVRGDALLEAGWLADKEDTYGFLTDPMNSLGIFDLFHTGWFALLLAVTVVSTAAYVVSRFPGVWQTITRPRKRVPDRYFDLAPDRIRVEGAFDADQFESALRRSRYKVERWQEGEATMLFADRFQVAALGSLLTHAAVIVFILAAVVSRVDAFSSGLFLAEGNTLPVFPVTDSNQMQVQLLDAHAEFAPDGQALDYRTDIAIYQGGDEALRCSSTVNTPCKYNGYRFYQVAYFGYGAELAVRDTATGNIIYRETLALADRSPAAALRITDPFGATLLDRTVTLPETIEINDQPFFTTLLRLDDGTPLTLLLPTDATEDDDLLVFNVGDEANTVHVPSGGSAHSGSLNISYDLQHIPSAVVPEFPLSGPAGTTEGDVLLQLNNVVYGTDTTSEGTAPESSSTAGDPELTIVGVGMQPAVLSEGGSFTLGQYEFTFEGQREFAGIDVRRDRSDYLVWAGAAAIVLGLMITFWVPRRRLWAKITANGASLAGQAAGPADYTSEMWRLAAKAGATVPAEMEDDV